MSAALATMQVCAASRRRLPASRAAQTAQHPPACLLDRRIDACVVPQPSSAGAPLLPPLHAAPRRSRRPAWPPPSAASSCRRGASWRGLPPARRWRSSARRQRRRPRRSRIACACSTCPRSPAPRRPRTGRAVAMALARYGLRRRCRHPPKLCAAGTGRAQPCRRAHGCPLATAPATTRQLGALKTLPTPLPQTAGRLRRLRHARPEVSQRQRHPPRL